MQNNRLLTELKHKLKKIDGKIYKNFKSIKGIWCDQKWKLIIDSVQADTSAPPSHLRIQVPNMVHSFPPDIINCNQSVIALSDFILRKFHSCLKKISKHSGSGKSGNFYCDIPGQQILKRSSVSFSAQYIELRMRYGLPAAGNRIDSNLFIHAIEKSFPFIVDHIMTFSAYDEKKLYAHINLFEDQNNLRKILKEKKIAAFINNGSILPRESSQSNLKLKDAVPFKSPKSLEKSIELPSGRKLKGMAIPEGVTFITGGGFHGKSTLLNAILNGIYNHIHGDGREFVISHTKTFKVNVESGRYASNVDISSYINHLPFNKDSSSFSSDQCSGSTSQAATVIESLRMNVQTLLFDEDLCATNFLICDRAMDEIIGDKDKTITPYLQSAKDLFKKHQVSTIVVAGSFSPSLEIANLILKMSNYKTLDITKEAKDIVHKHYSSNYQQTLFNSNSVYANRYVNSNSFRIKKRTKPFKGYVLSKHKISIDKAMINFFDNQQIIDISQTKTMLKLIYLFEEKVYKRKINFEQAVKSLFDDKGDLNISLLDNDQSGFTAIRPIDLAHAINRFRFLKTH